MAWDGVSESELPVPTAVEVVTEEMQLVAESTTEVPWQLVTDMEATGSTEVPGSAATEPASPIFSSTSYYIFIDLISGPQFTIDGITARTTVDDLIETISTKVHVPVDLIFAGSQIITNSKRKLSI